MQAGFQIELLYLQVIGLDPELVCMGVLVCTIILAVLRSNSFKPQC